MKPTFLLDLWHRWFHWSSISINRGIFQASLTIAVLSLIVKLASVAKDIEVARVFGVSDALDAFLMAFMVPTFAVSVFAGSFYSSLVPVFVEVDKSLGEDQSRRLTSNILFVALVVLMMVTFLLYTTGEWLIEHAAFGFSRDKLNVTIRLYERLLPLVLLGGLAMLGAAILNAKKKFARAAIAPLFTPLAIVIVLLSGASTDTPDVLVTGSIVGVSIELGLIVWGLWNIGYLTWPSYSKWGRETQKVIANYLPMMAGAFIMSGTVIVDQVMASWLPSGSVSVLNYANKLPSFFIGLAATAIGTAVLPYLSQQVAERDYKGLKYTLNTYFRFIMVLSASVLAFGLMFNQQIVRLIFERGAFDTVATLAVSDVQAYALLQIPFYILGTMLARFVSALEGNKFLMYVAIISLVGNSLLNFILMQSMGVAGIALSTAIVYMISMFMMYWYTISRISIKLTSA